MKTDSQGFTLIETLVYLALFALIMSGLVASAYSIFEGNNRTQTKTVLQEEGDFLLAKLNQALDNAQTIAVTNPWPATDSALVVTKYDGSSVSVYLAGTDVQLSRDGGATWLPLNNANVRVTALSFLHRGSGADPESLTATTTLDTLTPNGQPYTQTFFTAKYLRK